MPHGLYRGRSSTQAIYRFDNNLTDIYGNDLTCSGTDHYGQDHSRFGTHGIQFNGEYAYLAGNFGWNMHTGFSIIFWMKCTAISGGGEFIKVIDSTYNGAFGLRLADNSGSIGGTVFLYKYNTSSTAVYESSPLSIGTYGYWSLFHLRYLYSGSTYYVYLFEFDPTGQTVSGYKRQLYIVGSVNQAQYTGTLSPAMSDSFYVGDISTSSITAEVDELIVDTTYWNDDELRNYYSKVSSGWRGPKAAI